MLKLLARKSTFGFRLVLESGKIVLISAVFSNDQNLPNPWVEHMKNARLLA